MKNGNLDIETRLNKTEMRWSKILYWALIVGIKKSVVCMLKKYPK